MEKKKLSMGETGLEYHKKFYFVDGYISDYALTYDEDIIAELSDDVEPRKTVSDFKHGHGYVDDRGFVYIYYKVEPEKKDSIPWFIVYMTDDGKPGIYYSQTRSEESRKAFRIERVTDKFEIKRILNEADASKPLYDESVLTDVLNSRTSSIKPISKDDDWLKKVVKQVIEEKGGDPHRIKSKLDKSFKYSNMTSALNGTTKMSPIQFAIWMELLDCDYEITVSDNGVDEYFPLKNDVVYRSDIDELLVEKGEDTSASTLRSAKQ